MNLLTTLRKWVRTERPRYRVEACALSDVGCVRPGNEDSMLIVNPAPQHPDAARGVLALVADGMGGSLAGEIASRMAAEAVRSHYLRGRGAPLALLAEALALANRSIHEAARGNPAYAGMGTTATVLLLRDGAAYFAHVGDSRLYKVRGNGIRQLSEDHTLVAEMVRGGMVAPADAASHPDRNLITRAVGTRPQVAVDVARDPEPLALGDCFVLCSDGLHDLVQAQEICTVVAGAAPQAACRRLVELARQRGGHDNVSVGVLGIRPQDEAPPRRAPITRTEIEVES